MKNVKVKRMIIVIFILGTFFNCRLTVPDITPYLAALYSLWPVEPSGLMYSEENGSYTINQEITNNVPSYNGIVKSFSINPDLPTGLSLDSTNGIISGTPTTESVATDYIVTASNDDGYTTKTISITVSGNSSTIESTYSISGMISGLTSSGLIIQNNGGMDLSITSGSTSFTFSSQSGSYNVTVFTQPSGQNCTVSNGSGTATANVTNVSIICGNIITRSWGTFTDLNDGTVKLVVNAGTYGGNTYTSTTLYFDKCSHGQIWNSSSNDCTGTGNSGNNYGATQVQYCSTSNNNCNGGINSGILDGGGTSGVFTACNGSSLVGKSWRVPTKDELKLLINCTITTEMPNDGIYCSSYTLPPINNLFPNSLSDRYWSGNSSSSSGAFDVNFGNGGAIGSSGKTNAFFVRCVSD